jgi:flagellar motor protein MotB
MSEMAPVVELSKHALASMNCLGGRENANVKTVTLLGIVLLVGAAGMIGCTDRADQQLIQVQEHLEHVFGMAFLNRDMKTQLARDHLTIVITEQLLFVGEGHEIRPDGKKVLKQMAGLFGEASFREIRVAGHVDKAVSDQSLTYFEKLELSKARAMQTGRVLKENGLNSQNVIIEWYGDIRPIASNETSQGRQMNRRVEIVVYSEDSGNSSGSIATMADRP